MGPFTKLAYDARNDAWLLGDAEGKVRVGPSGFITDAGTAHLLREPIKLRSTTETVVLPVLTTRGLGERHVPVHDWRAGWMTFRGAFDAETHQWFVVDYGRSATEAQS